MAAAAAVTCPKCGHPVTMSMEGLGQSQGGREAIVRVDTRPFIEHLNACTGDRLQVQSTPASQEQADVFAQIGPLVQSGRRACVMCGLSNAECYAMSRRKGAACCSACGNGNTHPTPKETLGCAEWAAEHGASG